MLIALGIVTAVGLLMALWGARACWVAVTTDDKAKNPTRAVVGSLAVVFGSSLGALCISVGLVGAAVRVVLCAFGLPAS